MAFQSSRSDRYKAALVTLLVQGALFYALLIGLSGGPVTKLVERSLIYIDLPPPAPPPEPPVRRAPRPQAAAAPANRVARATPLVVPPPVVPVIEIPPVVAAPVAGIMADSDAGAAPTPGPGSAAGGEGTGTGQGGNGDGDGGGGTHARWRKGRISSADYPKAAVDAGLGGGLVARYSIGADGQVTRCEIVESSGSALLDETTCRLVVKRFRFVPARDGARRAVPDTLYEDHHWVFERRGGEEQE